MPVPSIYAVQVRGGSERRQLERLLAVPSQAVKDCFIPEYEIKRARHGEWRTERALLFPGYLFIETIDPPALAEHLAQTAGFTRLLGAGGERSMPLTSEEAAWLDVLTEGGSHVVRMSEGVIEGDRVMVSKGPLRGHEAKIAKIDRHKRTAVLEMRMFNQVRQVTVGLEIVAKRP